MNNLRYSLRNIKQNKLIVVITTIGLSIALASMLIIYLFVSQEKSYDTFHSNTDHIFRVNYMGKLKDGTAFNDALVNPDLAKEIKEKVPQVKKSTPYRKGYMAQLAFEDENMKIELGIAEQDFFDMFDFGLLYGNRNTLLVDPTNIVITESLARKISGAKNVDFAHMIGQHLTFTFMLDIPFTIVGILEDIPKNSSLVFDAVIPYEYEDEFWQASNDLGNSLVYFEIKKGADIPQTNAVVCNVTNKYYENDIVKAQRDNVLSTASDCFVPYMLPLKALYLNNQVSGHYEITGNKTQLYILSVVALLIIVIAVSNYVILSIGQFFKKAGEVSIRKSMGSGNIDIIKMFISDNTIMILSSFIIGGILCIGLIPVFEKLSQSKLYLELANKLLLTGFSLSIIILLISLTSMIPFFVFRQVKPTLLTSKKLLTGKKTNTSHIFVSLQYALTIVLIVSTIVIYRQTNYLKNKSLGFSQENIIDVTVSYLNQSKCAILRDQLRKYPGVINVALTDRDYLGGYSTTTFDISENETMTGYVFKSDHRFIPILNIELLTGRNFTESNINDNDHSAIINETFASRMGFGDNPVGQTVTVDGIEFKVIGLVKDYQFLSAIRKMEPMILYTNTQYGEDYNSLLVKYTPENIGNVISAIKKEWKEMGTNYRLDYTFWDKELENRYQSEERLSKIIAWASVIAIIISSLGLFGLTVLISYKRTNEIGIRKVNGAKVREILTLLNTEYIKWVVIASIVAIPSAWFLMDKWLENFAYKTALSWWIFALAGLLALGIALLTVSWHSWRAATRNPVEALRYE